jgi:large conductance mechanosensitive channel
MKNFLRGFQQFIMKGNVLDLAVAVIIGAAFSKIIESFVADIITPVILNPALKAAQVENIAGLAFNGIQYGLFLSSVINFLVIALCLYSIIQVFERARTKLERKKAVEEVLKEPTEQEVLINSIVDLTNTINKKL